MTSDKKTASKKSAFMLITMDDGTQHEARIGRPMVAVTFERTVGRGPGESIEDTMRLAYIALGHPEGTDGFDTWMEKVDDIDLVESGPKA